MLAKTPKVIEVEEAVSAAPPELILDDIRTDSRGNQTLYFPFQTISDIHWGTRQCRAKKLAHMLRHTMSDRLYLVGDIIDGEYLADKRVWKFGGEAHRLGIAEICRKADYGTQVCYIPGNHDEGIRNKQIEFKHAQAWVNERTGKVLLPGQRYSWRNLCGKSIFGIRFEEEAHAADPVGRKIKLKHGDQYDDAVFGENKGLIYSLGDKALNALVYVDGKFQKIPRFSHISIAATLKRATKTIINGTLGVHKQIMASLDEDAASDVMIYGHSHMEEIVRTPLGKLLINDGCCTEHVQTLVQDRNGTFALLEWHSDYLKIQDEHGRKQVKSWDELGLGSFRKTAHEPHFIEGEYAGRADRLIRLFYRMWPAKDRKQMLAVRDLRQAQTTAFIPLPNRHYQEPLDRPMEPKIETNPASLAA